MAAPGPPASRTDDDVDVDVEQLREALAEEHDRALRAGEDARRAERETLTTRRELHRVKGQLRELRERHRAMAGRRSIRLADRALRRRAWLSRRARSALRGVLGVGRSGRTPSPAGPPPDPQPRVVAPTEADPRQLPGHYR